MAHLVVLFSEVELFFPKHDHEDKKRLSSTKENRFSKLLSKRAILALFFSQCNGTKSQSYTLLYRQNFGRVYFCPFNRKTISLVFWYALFSECILF